MIQVQLLLLLLLMPLLMLWLMTAMMMMLMVMSRVAWRYRWWFLFSQWTLRPACHSQVRVKREGGASWREKIWNLEMQKREPCRRTVSMLVTFKCLLTFLVTYFIGNIWHCCIIFPSKIQLLPLGMEKLDDKVYQGLAFCQVWLLQGAHITCHYDHPGLD